MSASRREFFDTLRHMRELARHNLLTDTFPPTDVHNVGARILRLGLSVSAFAMLERYAQGCFNELVKTIGGSRVKYPNFSDKLKQFLTIDAVSGLSNRIQFLDPSDRQSFVDNQISLLASYSSDPAIYTALGFSPRGSNVSNNDISAAFSACGIRGPWDRLAEIASSIGGSRLSLSVDYRNLAKTRHSSAHDPSSNVASADLQTNIELAIVIGIAIDVLSISVSKVFLTAKNQVNLEASMGAITHKFRFIDQQSNGTWIERNGGRVIKIYPDEAAATAGALGRSRAGSVIARDVQQVPLALLG